MADSWLKLLGTVLLGADEYLQYLETQKKTEPVHSDVPEKEPEEKWGRQIIRCRNTSCDMPIVFAMTQGYWVHTHDKRASCGLVATPPSG